MKRIIVTILAGIGGLSLGAVLLVVVLARLMGSPEDDDFNIEREVNSPDGAFRATHFVGMGGGAAGWCQQVVTVKPTYTLREIPRDYGRPFNVFSVSCGTNVQMHWTGNSELLITFSAKDHSAGTSAYFRPENSTGDVHVRFNIEA